VSRPDLVSVVIPAYNAAETLKTTVASALGQTHAALDIIIVDDGSTDITPAIAREIAASDNRVRYVRKDNGGVATARNFGIALAEGAFVAPLDADDIWHPTKIERQLDIMKASPTPLGFVYCGFRVIDHRGVVLGTAPYYGVEGWGFLQHVMYNFVGNGSGLLLRREAIEAVGGYDTRLSEEGLQGCEDYQLQIRIARRYPVAGTPENLVGYRVGAGRMSSDIERMLRSRIRVFELLLEEEPSLPPDIFAAGWGFIELRKGLRLFAGPEPRKGLAHMRRGVARAYPRHLASLAAITVGWARGVLRRRIRALHAKVTGGPRELLFDEYDPANPADAWLDPCVRAHLSALKKKEMAFAPVGQAPSSHAPAPRPAPASLNT